MNPQERIAQRKQEDLIYLKKKNVQGVFQELLAKLIQARPESQEEIKQFMIFELKKMKMNNKIEYFEEDDFELIFNTLNILREEELPVSYIFKALDMIGCCYEKDTVVAKHKLGELETIGKKQFVKVMKREYSKMVTIQLTDPKK